MKKLWKRLGAALLLAALVLTLLPMAALAAGETYAVTMPDTLVAYVLGSDTPLTGGTARAGDYINVYSADPTARELAAPLVVNRTDTGAKYVEATILHVPTTTSANKERGSYIQFQMPAYGVTLVPTFTTCLTGVRIESVDGGFRAAAEPAGATGNYAWFREDGEGWASVGTGATYSPKAADVGKHLKVEVIGTGAYSGTASAVTEETVAADSQVTGVMILRDGDPTKPATIDLTAETATAVLTANITPGVAARLTWTSSDPEVASVEGDATATPDENGRSARATATVTGHKMGTATITLAVNGKKDTRLVSVTDGTSASGSEPMAPTTQPVVITETKVNSDGSTTTTVTNNETGAVTAVTTKPDGAKVEKVSTPEEGTTIVATDPKGETVAEIVIPAVIPEQETKFVDVPDQHWAAESINTIAALGVVDGVGENKYDMTSDMTRGALA
ncbi:MAG: Ig-like domain-containing protein, partial [Roseburia sp.]|nr:Ig-like domain-containing protein [Roseburia sp.]